MERSPLPATAFADPEARQDVLDAWAEDSLSAPRPCVDRIFALAPAGESGSNRPFG